MNRKSPKKMELLPQHMFAKKITHRSHASLPPHSVSSGRKCRRRLSCKTVIPRAFIFAACAEILLRLRGHGALPAIGGAKTPGSRMNGKWISALIPPRAAATNVSQIHARRTGFIAFITTRFAPHGSRGAGTIDVHRTSCPLCFQFSRRRLLAGRIGSSVQGIWNGLHGLARSRRSVWRASFLSGCQESKNCGSHWRRSHFRRRLALSVARGIARRLPESLPLDYENEIACAEEQRKCLERGSGRIRRWTCVPHRRRGRPAGPCFSRRRNRKRNGMCPRVMRNIRETECLCRATAAFSARRRSKKPCGYRNCGKVRPSAAGHEWRAPCAARTARSAGRLHLHPASPHARNCRPPACAQFRASYENA